MIFKTPKKTPPYTQIHNNIINDPSLSGKAKWILIYLLSKPPDWKVYESDIVKHTKDGKQAVRTGIQELIKSGFIRRGQNRMQDGKFGSYEYDVSDVPEFIQYSTEVRLSDIGKSDISNINNTKTRKNTNKNNGKHKKTTKIPGIDNVDILMAKNRMTPMSDIILNMLDN